MTLPNQKAIVNPERFVAAQELVLEQGEKLSPADIRNLLEREGFEEPIIEHLSGLNPLSLVKYKAAGIKAWEK